MSLENPTSTTTVFKGDIQFTVGDKTILASDLATIDQVNTALDAIKDGGVSLDDKFIMTSPSTSIQTVNSALSLKSTATDTFQMLLQALTPNMGNDNYTSLVVGKSLSNDQSTNLWYKNPGIGGLGIRGTPDIIEHTHTMTPAMSPCCALRHYRLS